MTKETKLELFTERAKLAAGKQQTIDVLLRITPPELEGSSYRPKLNLSLVVDRSGSMEGVKMHHARVAANYCIDQLLRSDRLSVVIFDDIVDLLIPGQMVEDKRNLKGRVDSITARNSTALHEAWVRGGLEVSKDLDAAAINRVLLITDGQANVGETNNDRIVSQAQEVAARGVSTTTIGIGEDFNENLLLPMAEAGGGNAWHVEHAEDMSRIFAVELNGLLSQTGHTVTLSIKPAPGVTVADVLNDFEADGPGRYKIPNLRSGSPLDIVVRLQVPAGAGRETAELAQFGLAFIEQESQMPAVVNADLSVGFDTEEAVNALPENLEVARAVLLLMNARAREEAIKMMNSHDFAGAQAHIANTAAATQVFYARAASPDVLREVQDLQQVFEGMADRGRDSLSKKLMAYYSRGTKRGK